MTNFLHHEDTHRAIRIWKPWPSCYVYISHRLSSCRFCEKIAVFHKGSLVQLGTHEELLADTEGKYCEMWNAQAQYYKDTGIVIEGI